MSDAPSVAAIHDALLEIDLRKTALVDMTAGVSYGAPGNYVCRLCVAGVEISARFLSRPMEAKIAIDGHLSDWEIIDVCNLGFEDVVYDDSRWLFNQVVELANALKHGSDVAGIVDEMKQAAARLLEERRQHGLVPYYEVRKRRLESEGLVRAPGMAF